MRITAKNIIPDTNELIRQKSNDVRFPLNKEDEQLIKAMHQYVDDSTDPELSEKYDLKPAVGLAAIQVGELKKMIAIVINYDDEKVEYVLINPKIISHSTQYAYLAGGEGCLSVLDTHEGIVPRHARITVKAYDYLQQKEVQFRAKGYEAIVLQHEIDHLNGILFYDHIGTVSDAQLADALVID